MLNDDYFRIFVQNRNTNFRIARYINKGEQILNVFEDSYGFYTSPESPRIKRFHVSHQKVNTLMGIDSYDPITLPKSEWKKRLNFVLKLIRNDYFEQIEQ